MSAGDQTTSEKINPDLTVEDAAHILATDGWITPGEAVLDIVAAIAVAALTARAIVVGNATVWHLALPLLAQSFALLVSVPAIHIVVQHPEMKKSAVGSVRTLAGIAVAIAITTLGRSLYYHAGFAAQLSTDAAAVWRWITRAEMHWPIALAFLTTLASVPGRVRGLFEHGPPFVSVDLGCAMRIVVLMLGCVVIPFAVHDARSMAWFLWTAILVADLLAVWMHLDLQREVLNRAKN